MDRRRPVALILGLVLCLALLGRWALRQSELSESPSAAEATIDQTAFSSPAIEAPDKTARPTSGSKLNNATPGSGIFRGRIIDAVSRQPVREFELEFQSAQDKREAPEAPIHSFKTKDGRFEARGVPAGIWNIVATARGYQRFELTGVTIVNDKPRPEVLIPMRPGYVLQGRVYDESSGDGIAGAQVSFREAHAARYDGNFRNRPATTSRQDGAFTLNGLPEERIVVTAVANDYATREIELTVGNKMPPLEIALSAGGTIAGYLAGADGLTPVAGTITLANLDEGSGWTRPTGPAGEFEFRRLSPARYSISGRATGLAGKRDITITHNEQLEGIVLAMRGGHSIRGVVSGLKPDELRSTTVSVIRPGGYNLTPGEPVDERGGYEVTGVTPGTVRVAADVSSRRQIAKTVHMPADTDLTVNLEFPRGARLTGRITRGGKVLSGATVLPMVTTRVREEVYIYEVRTSATGEYVIEDIPHGEYTLRVGSYRSPIVRIDGDTVFDVDVPAAQLAGRVIEEGSNVPVVGAIIDVLPAQPGAPGPVGRNNTSDHFGQFAVRGMQPGDYVLSVYKAGYDMYREPLAYGSTISDLVIPLRTARGVEIKVRDAESGEAIDAINVQETLNGQPGLFLQLNLDQNGVGHLPVAMAGSSFQFFAMGYMSHTVVDWDGQSLDVKLTRPPVR